jgi:hypothetical protein
VEFQCQADYFALPWRDLGRLWEIHDLIDRVHRFSFTRPATKNKHLRFYVLPSFRPVNGSVLKFIGNANRFCATMANNGAESFKRGNHHIDLDCGTRLDCENLWGAGLYSKIVKSVYTPCPVPAIAKYVPAIVCVRRFAVNILLQPLALAGGERAPNCCEVSFLPAAVPRQPRAARAGQRVVPESEA